VAYVAMGMGMGYEDYDSPAVVGVDGHQPVSSSVSADSAEQTSGVDSPNFNPEATRGLYSHTHAGTYMYVHIVYELSAKNVRLPHNDHHRCSSYVVVAH
jgi:hypothetical protein